MGDSNRRSGSRSTRSRKNGFQEARLRRLLRSNQFRRNDKFTEVSLAVLGCVDEQSRQGSRNALSSQFPSFTEFRRSGRPNQGLGFYDCCFQRVQELSEGQVPLLFLLEG